MLRIGLDFDNTIICYDELFYAVAREMALIPGDLPRSKNSVRDYLRKINRENDWTELQGIVYGPQIHRAQFFPGVFDFLRYCRENSLPVFIISHKTKHPYLGEKFDLHQYARDWLEQEGFFDSGRAGISRDSVFFEPSKEDKLRRIGNMACTRFMDDLPEFLSEGLFPSGVVRILFDPNQTHASCPFERVAEWKGLLALIKKNQKERD